MLLRRRGEALEALQHIVDTAFRRELKDDRSFVVDCLDYRKGKDAELRQMARFMMEKAKSTGAPQEMGPLNPYARRLVHLTVAEDPQMSSESIGDAFLKTVIISVARSQAPRPATRPASRLCSARPTPSSRSRRRRAAAASASCASAEPRRASIAAASDRSARSRFEPRHATLAERHGRTNGARRSRRSITVFPAPHSYTGEDVVEISAHGSPVLLQADRRGSHARRRPAGRARRVHASRVSERPDRSRAGRGGSRSDRRGDAAAGARGVRSARGHADRRHRARSMRRSSTSVARLEASLDFPDEGYHFVERSARPLPSSTRRVGTHRSRCWPSARRGRLIREGLQVVIAGRPNVGKSTSVQRVSLERRGDRHAGARDDARSGDRSRRHRRRAGHARRHGRGARRAGGCHRSRRHRARRRRAAPSPRSIVVVLDRSVPLTEDDRALLAETAGTPRVIVANKSRSAACLGTAHGPGETSCRSRRSLATASIAFVRRCSRRSPGRCRTGATCRRSPTCVTSIC